MGHHKNHDTQQAKSLLKKRWTEWIPLAIVFGFILMLSFLTMSITQTTQRNFLSYSMGYFFLLFSLFKLIDLKAFVAGYQEYDILSKAWPSWAYFYPFLELWLGALYLSRKDSLLINLITIATSLITCLSVGLSLRKKEALHCVCLGTVLKVPLTTISFAEYGLMAIMAVFMILSSPKTSSPVSAHRNYDTYRQLYGEAYDKAYLHEMTEHHQGALDMAELVSTRTAHPQLTEFAASIDKAQRSEIAQMNTWQHDWGYHEEHMHDGMSMHDHMDHMTNALKDLEGDDFDKRFLELMIEHHQDAIDMSVSGSSNASRDELRKLTRDIVSAQTKEIAQMRQWQHDWGYIE